MKCRSLVLVGLLSVAVAGCGSSSSGGSVPASGLLASIKEEQDAAPNCSALVGKVLTKASEQASCNDSTGTLQLALFLPCAHGTMIAFGKVIGGKIGQPAKAGDYSAWPGC